MPALSIWSVLRGVEVPIPTNPRWETARSTREVEPTMNSGTPAGRNAGFIDTKPHGVPVPTAKAPLRPDEELATDNIVVEASWNCEAISVDDAKNAPCVQMLVDVAAVEVPNVVF